MAFRPRLEGLEGREVPAAFRWLGGFAGGDFDDSRNWKLVAIDLETEEFHEVPWAGDAVEFGPTGAGVSNPCPYMRAASGGDGSGAYGSVTLAAEYASTVTLATALATRSLVLQGGTIDQPTAGRDITVIGGIYGPAGYAFHWTGGTLNSQAHLANVTITGSGATALFEPAGGGTVVLGSNVTLEDGAEGTIKEGTIDTNKDGVQFITSTGSNLSLIPNALIRLGLQFPLDAVILPNTSWTAYPGETSFSGPLTNSGGTVTLLPDARVFLAGNAGGGIGYAQWGGQTYLYGNSKLTVLQSVLIQGGTLATVWAPSVSSGTARIVAGRVEITGGDIYVSMQQGPHVNFGELIISGRIEWTGGTFHPYVYSDGVAQDVLRQSDTPIISNFTIDGGAIAPVYLDSDYGTSSPPQSGSSWKVLLADGGFTTNTAPTVNNNFLWSMQIDPVGNPPKYWRLIAN